MPSILAFSQSDVISHFNSDHLTVNETDLCNHRHQTTHD